MVNRAAAPDPPRAPGAAWWQYPLPHHLLSALMQRLTRIRLTAWKNRQIDWFIRRYRVDMREAQQPDPHAYPDFNAFFTRALAPDCRPLAAGARTVACPADGRLSEFGHADGDVALQAKGMQYSLRALLGGDAALSRTFADAAFLTVYLSPRDYHRVHMPLGGTLRRMIHVPGRLFSVNPRTAAAVPGLFARNERVIAVFDTVAGPMAVVMVGAVFVGSIEMRWCGQVTPPRAARVRHWHYAPADAPTLERGAELGRFNMGSTVVLLLPARSVDWARALRCGAPLRCGAAIGSAGGAGLSPP